LGPNPCWLRTAASVAAVAAIEAVTGVIEAVTGVIEAVTGVTGVTGAATWVVAASEASVGDLPGDSEAADQEDSVADHRVDLEALAGVDRVASGASAVDPRGGLAVSEAAPQAVATVIAAVASPP
jgi:hypothetical protein